MATFEELTKAAGITDLEFVPRYDAEGGKAKKKVPRYMQYTSSASRREKLDAKVVNDAWNKTSFLGLRSLPASISPGFSASQRRTRRRQIAEQSANAGNLLIRPPGSSTVRASSFDWNAEYSSPSSKGAFEKSNFVPNEYDGAKRRAFQDSIKSKTKRLGGSAFTTGGASEVRGNGIISHTFDEYVPREESVTMWPGVGHGLDPKFRMPTIRSCAPRHAERPHAGLSRPSTSDSTMSTRFTTGGSIRDKRQKMKASSGAGIARLEKVIKRDWPGLHPHISQSQSLHWVVRFQSFGDDDDGQDVGNAELLVYMRALAKTDPIVAEYCLRKDAFHWNVQVGDWVEFAFRPPWTKMPMYEFFSSAPDELELQFRKWGAEPDGRKLSPRGSPRKVTNLQETPIYTPRLGSPTMGRRLPLSASSSHAKSTGGLGATYSSGADGHGTSQSVSYTTGMSSYAQRGGGSASGSQSHR